MKGNPQSNLVRQVATIVGYQTLAMGLMILGASFLANLSVADNALDETAQVVQCSPASSPGTAGPAGTDFLDLTVAWLLD